MKVVYVGGCGRLGLALAAVSADCGHEVVCADINRDMVDKVNAGQVDTWEPDVAELVEKYAGKNLTATTDIKAACSQAELVCILVPTPSLPNGGFSNEYILEACEQIGFGLCENRNPYPVVSVVSTVMPGSIDIIAGSLSAWAAGVLGEEWGIVYSPEFVAQGSIVKNFRRPDMVMIGSDDERATEIVGEYYFSVVTAGYFAPHCIMSVVSAEIAKLALNVSVVTKIQLANQIAMLCHETPGASVGDVLGAIGDDSRIGHKYFSAGVWPGGPCFRRDPRALSAHAATVDCPSLLIDGVDVFTNVMAHWLAAHVMEQGEVVGILGLTYKPDIDIMDESPGVLLGEMLPQGTYIYYHDPARQQGLSLVEMVEHCDVLVIMTPWEEYGELEDMDLGDTVVFDMWGLLNPTKIEHYVRFGWGSDI